MDDNHREKLEKILKSKKYTVKYRTYNWDLNGVIM